MALSLYTEPSVEPLTLAQVKLQVRRKDVTDDDEYLEDFVIPAVRGRCESETGRQLITAVWDLKLDRFPCDDSQWIDVPKPPLVSVTSITYVDSDGATQTWSSSNYQVDAPVGPNCRRGRILPAYGVSWPSTRDQMNAVTVRFSAGYGASGVSIPPELRSAMLLDAGSLFENREEQIVGQGYVIATMPIGAKSVYARYRSWA